MLGTFRASRLAGLVVILFTSAAGAWEFAEPGHRDAACQRNAFGRAMPDLGRLALRTDPRLHAGGFLIKGMYYGPIAGGPHELLAFRLGCAGRLDPRPFLVVELASWTVLIDGDGDGDGCVDDTAIEWGGEVDPVDYLPALPPARLACGPRF